jgi:hypothetical protein
MVMVALLLATVVAPVALAYWLRRTRAWWVAGLLVAAVGLYFLLPIEVSVYRGAGERFVWGIGALLLAHAAILLLASRESPRERRPRGPRPSAWGSIRS